MLTFTDLLKQDGSGNDYEYSVKERSVPRYAPTIAGDAASGYRITNQILPETITIKGSKIWRDNHDQDGKRPDYIKVRLLKNNSEIFSKIVTEADQTDQTV